MTRPTKGESRPDPMAFGRGLPNGLGVNLLVRDMESAIGFHEAVLGASVIYWEDHFAVVQCHGSEWLLHSDWSYRDHELHGAVASIEARGAGLELRLYGVDPDECEQRARSSGATVLAGAADKPHGLREAHIIDDDGYVWVPSVALPTE